MNQITVYQTDADGAFLHSVVANELALAPGFFNVPHGAKLTAPPEVPADHVAVALGDDWITTEEHRKETLYVAESGVKYDFNSTIITNATAARYTGGSGRSQLG